MNALTFLLLAIGSALSAFPSFAAGFAAPTITTGTSPTRKAPPSEAEIIDAARKVMANTGYFDPIDEALFADDFVFRGPVIGPLNLADYREVLDYFSIHEAFPDIDPGCYGYGVDPEDPYRVWYFVRASGTYQRPIGGPLGAILKPDGRRYRGSPEAWSITFDENLKARLITAGYVADRFDDDATTDGAGLSFGILKTIGVSLPFGVGDAALQMVQAVNGPLAAAGISPKSVSAVEDVPSWWTNEKRGAQP